MKTLFLLCVCLQVLSVRDAQGLLKDEEDLVIAVYDYWLAKRLRLGRALIPAVKHERRDGTSSNNPYLAFRKRTEKMQTRKVSSEIFLPYYRYCRGEIIVCSIYTK